MGSGRHRRVGFLDTVHVSTTTAGSATAGFATGAVAGAFFGQNLNAHWSGEIRYEFFATSPKLSGDGSSPHSAASPTPSTTT